jgi:hypothetical protein
LFTEHGDTYARFRELYSWDGDIHRAIFYMEDWQSGHISEIEKQPLINWHAGDYIIWKNDTLHLAANVGKTPRYTLQITGVIEVKIRSFNEWDQLRECYVGVADMQTGPQKIRCLLTKVKKHCGKKLQCPVAQ